MLENQKTHRHLTSFQLIFIGFFAVILVGTLLLMLPFSTKESGCASFTDCLFTATSAVCVTGLVIHDTATYWSTFGQAVILIMIQIGGMGVITFVASLSMLSRRKLSLNQRNTMQEALSAHKMGGIANLTVFVVRTSLLIEITGAMLLLFPFVKEFGLAKGIWYSVFHSVSAFCNAGFDLMGVKEKFSSLTSFSSNPLVCLTVIALIVSGGIGFLTWEDIKTSKLRFKKYRLQTKLVIVTTLILIIVPALLLFFFVFTNKVFSDMSFSEKILASLFQSVTPRTAGFNTVDLTLFSKTGQLLIIVLMLIGGSSGSTAGGMKVTTISVLVLNAFSVFKRKENTTCFGRRIEDKTVNYASTIAIMYIVLFLFSGVTVSMIEGLPLISCLFECASAIGTVGLSLGITSQLGIVSRIILIMLMFFGRVGGLNIIFAAMAGDKKGLSKLPREKVIVG